MPTINPVATHAIPNDKLERLEAHLKTVFPFEVQLQLVEGSPTIIQLSEESANHIHEVTHEITAWLANNGVAGVSWFY